jgi:hypothetical protein
MILRKEETESTTTNEELNNVFIEIPKVSIPNNLKSKINELNEEQYVVCIKLTIKMNM